MARSDEEFMRLALIEAGHALANDWIPVGAVFVHDGKVIMNGRKLGTEHVRLDHAEHNGCRQLLNAPSAPPTLEGVTVYTTLEPCHMCMSLLMTARVSRIVYALDDPNGGAADMLRHPELLPPRYRTRHPAIAGGVLKKESARMLKTFFEKPRGEGAYWTDFDNPLIRHALAEAA